MNLSTVESYLLQTWESIKDFEQSSPSHKVLKTNNPAEVKENLNPTFPTQGQDYSNLLLDMKSEILPFLNRNTDVNFGAYITGGGNPISALAEFVKAFYNQNGLKWNNSPIAAELEQLVLRWVAEFVHLPQFSKGMITSGGSMSNFMAIHLALASKFQEREHDGLFQQKPFVVYCSDQTHSSVDRAMVFLGLGRNNLSKIPVNNQFQIQTDVLRKTIISDRANGLQPLMIVGNAGITNTGSIDDLNSLADIAQEFDLWYHVDGAYGLPAIRIPELSDNFIGVERADSVVINPHKWMYVTFEASCLLLKEIPKAIHFSPDYLFTENPELRKESSEHTVELSKEFRALKIWFTMKYYGAEKLTEFVKKDIDQTQLLAQLLSENPNVVVEPEHPLSILCFRYENKALSADENESISISALRKIESDGKIFITGTKLHGKTHLRVYFGHPERTDQDVRYFSQVILDSLT